MKTPALQAITVEAFTELVCERLALDRAEVTPTAHLIDDLGADSLDVMELCLFIEEQYNVEIPEDDYEQLVTLEQATAYLRKRLSEA